MGIFADARQKAMNSTVRDPYFAPDAEFLVKVEEVSKFTSKLNARKGPYIKIRGVVVDSNAQSTDDGSTIAHRAGQRGVQLIDLSNGDAAMNDVSRFAVAVYKQMDPNGQFDVSELSDEEFEAAIEALFTEDQPAKGLTLGLRTQVKITKNKGAPFTQHFWEPSTGFAVVKN
jgi:hypothetical protein